MASLILSDSTSTPYLELAEEADPLTVHPQAPAEAIKEPEPKRKYRCAACTPRGVKAKQEFDRVSVVTQEQTETHKYACTKCKHELTITRAIPPFVLCEQQGTCLKCKVKRTCVATECLQQKVGTEIVSGKCQECGTNMACIRKQSLLTAEPLAAKPKKAPKAAKPVSKKRAGKRSSFKE